VGAQGGDLEAALRAGLRAGGWGLLLPVSRAISRSPDPRREAENLRVAIQRFRDRLGRQHSQAQGRPEVATDPTSVTGHPDRISAGHLAAIAAGLIETGCVKFGQFTLKSGLESPFYIDLRRLAGFPSLLAKVAQAYLPVLRSLSFDRLGALPYAALPIATAISLQSGWPLVYPRKESKGYGTRAEIEGGFNPGETAVVIDDLATTGGSKFEAIEKLTAAGLIVSDVVVLIDRQSGAGEALAQAGYRMHAVFTLSQLLDRWEQAEQVSPEQAAAMRAFLQ
jgi:uridine monophosphate synthetase